jgi:hypothetical protein
LGALGISLLAVVSYAAVSRYIVSPSNACESSSAQILNISAKALFPTFTDTSNLTYIEVLPANATTYGVAEVAIYGPLLGSMDTHDISTHLSCGENEVSLTATLTRSPQYDGSAKTNVIWRPEIELLVHAPVKLDVRWLMYFTNGVEVAKDVNVPSQTFPMEFSKEIDVPGEILDLPGGKTDSLVTP